MSFDYMSPCFVPSSPITPVLFTIEQSTPPPPPKFKAAGCFFTDNRYFLAGYQQIKATPRISGIGGAKQEGETPIETALRETVEELFDLNVPRDLLIDLETFVPPRRIVRNNSYYLICYTFEDLEMILMILGKHYTSSPLYDTFPATMTELLFNRKVRADVEISHLALLPFVEHSHTSKSPFVCPVLLADIKLIYSSYNNDVESCPTTEGS